MKKQTCLPFSVFFLFDKLRKRPETRLSNLGQITIEGRINYISTDRDWIKKRDSFAISFKTLRRSPADKPKSTDFLRIIVFLLVFFFLYFSSILPVTPETLHKFWYLGQSPPRRCFREEVPRMPSRSPSTNRGYINERRVNSNYETRPPVATSSSVNASVVVPGETGARTSSSVPQKPWQRR